MSTLASYSASEPNNCYAALIKYLAHLYRKSRRKTLKWYRKRQNANRTGFDTANAINEMTHTIALGSKRLQKRNRKSRKKHLNKNYNYVKNNDFKSDPIQNKGPKPRHCDKACAKPCSSQPTSARFSQCLVTEAAAPRASPEVSDIDLSYSPARNDIKTELTSTAIKEKISLVKSSNKYNPNRDETKEKSVIHQTYIQAMDSVKRGEISDNHPFKTFHLTASKSGRHCSAPTLLFLRPTPSPTFVTLKGELQSITETVASQSEASGWSHTEYSWDEDNEAQNEDQCKHRTKCYIYRNIIQSTLKVMVNHNYFKRAIFLAILFNTLCMGIEYHNQPQSLTHAVEISNVIFTGMTSYDL